MPERDPQSRNVREIKQRQLDHARKARKGTRYCIRELTLPGFCARVNDKGAWTLGIRRRIGKGPPTWRTIDKPTLAEARETARRWIALMRAGQDPRKVEKAAQAAEAEKTHVAKRHTFEAAWRRFEEEHVATLRPRSQKEIKRPYVRVFNVALDDDDVAFGPLPMRDITRYQIKYKIGRMPQDTPVAANRAQTILKGFFNWAIDAGYVEQNPCPLKLPHKEKGAVRCFIAEKVGGAGGEFDFSETIALWCASDQLPAPYGALFKTFLTTAKRRQEVLGMAWAELNLDMRTWIIPPERHKTGGRTRTPDAVALPDVLVAALRALDRDGPYVFTNDGKTAMQDHSGVKERMAKLVGFSDWGFHAFRHTVLTGLSILGTPEPIIQAVANHSHKARLGVTAIYLHNNPMEAKRQALNAWAQHIANLAYPPSGNIVPLAKSAPSG